MMMNKRLIGTVPESKKYIAGNVALQWCSLAANIAMMATIASLLSTLQAGAMTSSRLAILAVVTVVAVLVRYFCTLGASKMSYLSAQAVKKTLRDAIYQKLLRLGASYAEQVKISEVVQVTVEGVDQLETYFGAYLPQFFYAMLAPLTLLDEPTSNLDSLNEAVILKSLHEQRGGKTVVLVSHRASTMRIADQVYSVEHGRMS